MNLIRDVIGSLRRWSLRRNQYTGGSGILDALYGKADPWNLAGDDEQRRFSVTNRLIVQSCPTIDAMVEIGCGEGHQTRHFLDLAGHVTAIDVSANALARAKQAAPDALFLEGDIAGLRPRLPLARYDVATLCEVLYYMDDPAGAIAHAQGIADHVIVTIYAPRAMRLAPLLRGKGWQELPCIAIRRKRWRVYHWAAA